MMKLYDLSNLVLEFGLQVCRHFWQSDPVMGGKGEAHTVSLAPSNAPRGQNEKKKKKAIIAFPSLCHFKTPIW